MKQKIVHFARERRWVLLIIFLMLIGLYYQPGKWFSDPAATVVYDKDGLMLGAKIATDGQWRFPDSDSVPEKFRQAILAGEDQYFYFHPGFNPVSLARAGIQFIQKGRIISGGSTLSMQVARLSGGNRKRTITRKLAEILQAFRLELTHSKNEILNLYSSHAPFGGNVVGLEAAAWRYYGIPANNLSWGQTATLAVLPNAPAMIYPGKNQLRLKKKRDALLDKLCRKGLLDKYQCDLAKSEPLPGKPYTLPKMATHLTQRISAGTLAGQLLRTTLHQDLQDKVNEILSYHSGILKGNNIGNAAAIVISVENGEVLAYAGNVQPDERSAGNDVDIITSPRSTGSILKPFLYASALNEGLILPNTLLPDIPMQIGGFMPENYNQTYDGAVPAREALARSLNIPAVKLLQQYGYEQLYGQLKKMGMSTLSRPADHYGLSLILGGAETTLWDLASIYSSMARTLIHYQKSGKYDKNDFRQIKFIPDTTTEHNFKGEHSWLDAAAIYLTFEAMVEVVRPDEDFQWQQFSSGSRIAWKTGTSYGNRDGWAVGITPGYVVAVWTGNAGGEGRPGLTGTGCAAPILFDIFKALPSSAWFESPLQEMVSIPVCTRSGFRASSACETSEYQWVPKKGLQTSVCPFHKLVHLDAKGEYQVTSACESPLNMIHTGWFILPPAQEYFFRTKNPFYRTLPPFKPGCAPAGIRLMEMIYPENNSRIYVPVDIDGKPGSTVFHVAHRDPSKKIYWHLDDKFLGTTEGEHKMSLSPEKGLHRLVLVDESGETLNVNFEILRK